MNRTLLLLLALAAAAPSQPLPACHGPGLELLPRAAFHVCHSAAHRAPLWTAYRIGRERLTAPATASRRFRFRADPALAHAGAQDRDYVGSGFTRGHLVPAQDLRFDEAALRDSYLLSNAIPQPRSLNSGQWRALEAAVRLRAVRAGSATIYTGAIYCDASPRIGPGQVAAPCQLYKVAIFDGGEILAVRMPNGENPEEPWTSFITTLASLQRLTGLEFAR